MRHSSSWGGSLSRRGFTLVEMMIALVITLMIVFAMVEAFRWVGEATTDGRAAIEMLGQIRHARFRLEDDLSRCTASLTPWEANAELSQGYFELIEGSGNDNRIDPTKFDSTINSYDATKNVRLDLRYVDRNSATGYSTAVFNNPSDPLAFEQATLFGDVDDILMFTARNDDVPYRGRYGGVTIESNLAEIIWWTELNDVNASGSWDPGETFTIRRRVLLIRPDLNVNGYLTGAGTNDPSVFLVDNDISVRRYYDPATKNLTGIAANSLSDLTYRHNRTAHQPIDYTLNNGATPPTYFGLSAGGFMSPLAIGALPAFQTADLLGEDVVLTNVLAFDLRVWDPNVAVVNYLDDNESNGSGKEGIAPGDPSYNTIILANSGSPSYDGSGVLTTPGVVGRGAYIDLGVAVATGNFTNGMHVRARLNDGNGNFVYDPWTLDYERDGFNQDQDTATDEGTNGIDDDSQYGPDDVGQVGTGTYPGERETSPPYPHPLKSIQVRIRMYEPDTRQVRQASQVIKFRAE